MLFRSILALTAAASLALPAAAVAHRGPGHEGQFAAIAGDTAATTDQQPEDGAGVTIVDTPAADDTPAEDAPAKQERGDRGKRFAFGAFQRRVWRLAGEADGYDADRHALSVVVDEVGGLPKRQAARLRAALGEQLDVLVAAKTRVIGADGERLTGDAVAQALDAADSVKVTGKLAPRKAWAEDEDGVPVPALRALRIKIAG
jgi:hypothetical protein